MIRCFGALCDRLCVVICAILCVQCPLFIAQYTQQLVGREAELHVQVSAIEQAATITRTTVTQFIQKSIDSPDVHFSAQGKILRTTVDRWEVLNQALISLQNSSVFGRPFVFFVHLDKQTFQSTLHHYTFGLPTTVEGAVYLLAGVLLGYLICFFIRKLCGIILVCFRKKSYDR